MDGLKTEVAVIGGGIVGMASALALVRHHRLRVTVLEAEAKLAAHQSGHNSGVIHSGLYYKPGSLKARNCLSGRDALYRFCGEHGIKHERCGKIVVAVDQREIPALDELEKRGRANGLKGLRRLDAAGLREHEPHVRGLAGLYVPETGIVDYVEVTEAYARCVHQAGGQIRTGARVLACKRQSDGFLLETSAGEVACRYLVNCAGLHSDRVARMCGAEPGMQIVSFRGEYYELQPAARHLVRNLIYPVPDPRFPFLGVHFTRMIHGGVEAGPNAVLALGRAGYHAGAISARDTWEMARYPGFWAMARRHWNMGLAEAYRSLSKYAFTRALQRLVPELRSRDIFYRGAGVQAQALLPEGNLVDDFCVITADRAVHVLNAPSPAATASLAIGETVTAQAALAFGLSPAVTL